MVFILFFLLAETKQKKIFESEKLFNFQLKFEKFHLSKPFLKVQQLKKN